MFSTTRYYLKMAKRFLNGSKNEQTRNKEEKKTRCNLFLDWMSLKRSLFIAIHKKYKVQILPNLNRELLAACVPARLIAIIVKRSQ